MIKYKVNIVDITEKAGARVIDGIIFDHKEEALEFAENYNKKNTFTIGNMPEEFDFADIPVKVSVTGS